MPKEQENARLTYPNESTGKRVHGRSVSLNYNNVIYIHHIKLESRPNVQENDAGGKMSLLMLNDNIFILLILN